MLEKIIAFSLKNKLIIILFTLCVLGFGLFSLFQISIGAVPDAGASLGAIRASGRIVGPAQSGPFALHLVVEPASRRFAVWGEPPAHALLRTGVSLGLESFTPSLGRLAPRRNPALGHAALHAGQHHLAEHAVGLRHRMDSGP